MGVDFAHVDVTTATEMREAADPRVLSMPGIAVLALDPRIPRGGGCMTELAR